jgi:hypothetical protein
VAPLERGFILSQAVNFPKGRMDELEQDNSSEVIPATQPLKID